MANRHNYNSILCLVRSRGGIFAVFDLRPNPTISTTVLMIKVRIYRSIQCYGTHIYTCMYTMAILVCIGLYLGTNPIQ